MFKVARRFVPKLLVSLNVADFFFFANKCLVFPKGNQILGVAFLI
jgi:hypothetical protein